MGRPPVPAELQDPRKKKTSISDNKTRRSIEKKLREKTPKLTCPKYLSKEAKKEYRKFVKIYKGLDTNILSDLDVPTLAQYCEASAIYQYELEYYNKHKELAKHDSSVQIQVDRSLKIMERQTKLMSTLSQDLCITPVARARMGILTVKKETQQVESRKDKLKKMKDED